MLSRVKCFTVLMLFAVTGSARAFIGVPVVSPESPRAGDLVTLSIPAGECDYFYDPPNPLSVTVTGSTIRVLLRSLRNSPPFCIVPPLDFPFNVGRFPEGSYMLQVDRTYQYIDGPHTETIATLPLTIAQGAEPETVPTLSPLSRLLLALALGAVAFGVLQRRRAVSVKS